MSINSAYPQTEAQTEAAKRRLTSLYRARNQLYAKYLAPLDKRISDAEQALRRLEKPERYCRKCGVECNIGTKCPNESCENYSGVPF